MNDEFGFDGEGSRRGAKKGRRAEKQAKAPPAPEFEPTGNDSPQPPNPTDDGPPKPNRVSGWGEDAPRRRGRNLGEGFEQFEDDLEGTIDDILEDRPKPRKSTGWDSERLRPRSPEKSDESDNEIPVIPDLEDQQEEDLTQKIAYAPNVAVNRVATYRELDNDLLKQAAFLTLPLELKYRRIIPKCKTFSFKHKFSDIKDNEIDLKLLTKSLSTEADLVEEDKPWDWDRLFTEVTSELLTQMEKNEQTEPNEQSSMSQI